MTCDCKISKLEEKRIHISYTANSFDCLCETEHEVISTIYPPHKLNLVSFLRKYFKSRNCSCVFINKGEICKHCQYLKNSMNFFVPKICVEKKLLPKDFKVEKINQYLIKRLPADPVFWFSKEINMVNASIDSIDWGDFFIDKETILFTCFNDLVTTFASDKKNCLCCNRRNFFSCNVSDDRTILRKSYRCYWKSLKKLLVNFSLFIR